jgi:membrane protein YqaA with SNARE-associated domain
MRPWQNWLTRWNQRPYVQALVDKLAPLAGHPAFPLMGGVVALAATVTMSLPLVPVVCALVALNSPRWRAIVFWLVLGSAIGAVLLTFAFAALSLPWLDSRMPELMNSTHWKHLADWVARHGWWVLAGIAASPFSQTPALVLAAMLGMPLLDVFVAIALGKSVKYSLVARATQLMSDSAAFVAHDADNAKAGNETDQLR